MAWPFMTTAPPPQFSGVVERAANIGQISGDYTLELFRADFPQFFKTETNEEGETSAIPFLPESVMEDLVAQANASIQKDKWMSGWRFAAGLYVAHYATMLLRVFPDTAPSSGAEAAATGGLVGIVKKAQLGDSTVEYDTGAITQATAEWGDLNSTTYGQMLATRARLVGLGGMAAP